MTPTENEEPAAPRPSRSRGDAGLVLAHRAAALSREKKGDDLLLLDLRALEAVADFFLIVTAHSDVQVRAVAEHVRDTLESEGTRPWHVEGLENARWVLLDYVDVVVHVFHHETRSYYLLDRLWGDAEVVPLSEE